MSVVSNAVDVVTLGETMVVMAPERTGPLDAVDHFRKDWAGAESNVMVGLARLGHRTAWISRLGRDSFGRYIYKKLRGEGVDVSHVGFDTTHPTGVYFKEYGPAYTTNVYYYRALSAASRLGPEEVALRDLPARYLFVTGITSALGESCHAAVMEALSQARQLGMTVVFDPNLRLKLWPIEEARARLDVIAREADIVLPGTEEARLLTGRGSPEEIADHYLSGGAELVVVKLGQEGAYYRSGTGHGYMAGFAVEVVDEIGAGDAFDAGFLSGLLDGLALPEAIRRGNALGAMAVRGVGDHIFLPDRCELEAFLTGRETGR